MHRVVALAGGVGGALLLGVAEGVLGEGVAVGAGGLGV